MSGLCGAVDFAGHPIGLEALRAMADISRGRGPDGIRHLLRGQAGLCHLALHTSELLAERQPLSARNGAIHLVADARLDNRDDLIVCLDADGLLEGRDPSDAALLLAAYLRWGEGCPEHLLGDFAFALWDEHQQLLFCARDPLGIKPLHYTRTGALLVFASEAQQILQHPEVPRRLDEMTVADHLIGRPDDAERTFFQDVRRLPGGHRLIATRGGVRLERYWDVDPEARTVYRRNEEYADHFRELFTRAVADRLRACSGVAAIALSGGLDSGSVAAVAHRQMDLPGEAQELFGCSLIFDRLRECDERFYIQALAAELGFDVGFVEAERWWFLGDAEAYRPSLETPFLAWESCIREMLALARGRGARILLTGNGGDDLLSGSLLTYADRLRQGDLRALAQIGSHAWRRGGSWHRVLYHYLAKPFLAPKLDRVLRKLTGRPSGDPEIPDWIDPGFARRTCLAERLVAKPLRRFRDAARQEIYENAIGAPTWGAAVEWYDRHAGPQGIEVRHPFLDRRLVEFVLSIPPQQLFQAGSSKVLLRRSMEGILPDVVRLRTDKTMLGSFVDLGLKEKECEQIERLLVAPLAVDLGILDGRRLRAAYRLYKETSPGGTKRFVWYALMLEIWLQIYGGSLNLRRCARHREDEATTWSAA